MCFYEPWVRVTLRSGKGCHSGFRCGGGPDVWGAIHLKSSVDDDDDDDCKDEVDDTMTMLMTAMAVVLMMMLKTSHKPQIKFC